ncbi:MAG TPA: alkaline phosphatase family protein [Tepidisphaeraceae bacterium]|nr:alkaline phosphatase family protein [Tepidisphaeraceae bacterium]
MHKTVVINAVGLTPNLIGPHTPRLAGFRERGRLASVGAVIPAVTTSVQSTYLTGAWPNEHGIVGNGWYFRDECEVHFWKQAAALVQRPRAWERAKAIDSAFTCANLFWWYAMYATADYSVTPRPMYPADGRKIPDVWTNPPELREWLQRGLGQFPLFRFWGPSTNIAATQWIAGAAIRVDQRCDPTLSLIYLPHLDYCLQRNGPSAEANAKDLRELDAVCGLLFDHFASRDARVIVLSEYGITPVSRPVHLNRVLRESGLLTVRDEMGHELLDAGASAAFAVADHQVAHVYVNDRSRQNEVRALLEKTPGVARVLDDRGKREMHLDHPRAGDFVALAGPDSWFTYYYWLDDSRAPDFARTVDIHRKPGYDPAELFIDPKLPAPKAKIALALLKRKLGFRALMEVTPLDATLVRGSHGLPPLNPNDGPLLMTNAAHLLVGSQLNAIDVAEMIQRHVRGE